MLTPGKYEIVVQTDGYEPASKVVIVTNDEHTTARRADFNLHPMRSEEAAEQEQVRDIQLSCCMCDIPYDFWLQMDDELPDDYQMMQPEARDVDDEPTDEQLQQILEELQQEEQGKDEEQH